MKGTPPYQFLYKKCEIWITKNKIWSILLTVLLLYLSTFFVWYQVSTQLPQAKIYYQADFSHGLANWHGVDSVWVPGDQVNPGNVTISRKEFMAPYLMTKLNITQSPPESFVWHLNVRVTDFTNKAVTLGAIYLPTESIVLIVNKEGQLGYANNLFAEPQFANANMARLPMDTWQDLFVQVDNSNKTLTIYLNDQMVLIKQWNSPSYPVQQIWIGSVWVNGSGNYGAPMGVSYHKVELGNTGILQKPTPVHFVKNFLYKVLEH